MKKYILFALVLFTANFIYSNAMVASISRLYGENFLCSSTDLSKHYCSQLIEQINQCDQENGRAMILYDDESPDNIHDVREYDSYNNYIDHALYNTHIADSNIMMGHSRTDETGGDKPYNPIVWESRKDDAIYTFMSDEELYDTDLIDLLTEGGGDEWMYDAIDYLHSNSHNASLETVNYSDVSNAEYYFLWLIKNIEANRDVISGLKQALYKMNLPDEIGVEAWKNFIFSDGESLYLYRNGYEPYLPDERNIYYGIVELGGLDQDAYAVTTDEIGFDINSGNVAPWYALINTQVVDFELVVLHSDYSAIDHYLDFGNPSSNFLPEVDYGMKNGVNWKCFPVLDDDLNAQQELYETSNYFQSLSYHPGAETTIGSYAGLINHNLSYTDGYKLSLQNIPFIGHYTYTLRGTHVFEDQIIPLDAAYNKFWIPYFIKGKMSPYDAFSDFIDSATQIKGEYWIMSRKNTLVSWNVALYPGCPGFFCEYGKMYEIILTSGHPTSFDYYDEEDNRDLSVYSPPATEYYSATEGLDYEAILIDTIVSNEPIEEVAIFEGEDCIGASVFEGYPIFIRAFTDELNRGNEPLEFRVFTGSRAEPDVSYRIYDEDFAYYRDEPLYPREMVITRLCLAMNEEDMPVMIDDIVRTKQYPDPFNPETAIEYALPHDGQVSLNIYNIRGQKVKKLVAAEQAAGIHKVIWNGLDDSGKMATSGMYFYELIYNGQAIREKMILIK